MKQLIMGLGMVLSLSLTACGTYQQTVQVDDKAYLLVIGQADGSILTIDNDRPMEMGKDTKSFDLHGETATKIQVPVGMHTVKITRNGVLMVDRKFFVSNGTSFEVRL